MISAIVLTHNDEKSIEAALKSLTWCDEIILVDDYSTDETVETIHKVCKGIKFVKFKVFQRKLSDDFAMQRNFALQKAQGDWVLFVDSDEEVSKNLADEIQSVIPGVTRNPSSFMSDSGSEAGMTNAVGYYIKRSDCLFGKWLRYGEAGNMQLLRLAKRGAGKWIRPVHEVWDVKGETGILKSPLHHFPHPNVAQFLDEINYYSTLNARYLHSMRVPSHMWQILMYPKAKFFLNYVIRFGFLDGMQGLIFALLMSFHSFLTRAKLYQMYHPHTPQSSV